MKTKKTKRAARLALVIAVKGAEPLLAATISNARRSAGTDIDIICAYDGPSSVPAQSPGEDQKVISSATGSGPTRHSGIMAARSPLIVTCDAHMDFSNGWGVAVEDYLRGKPRTVACAVTRACDATFRRHDGKTRAVYTACRLAWIDLGPGETKCLNAKWHTHAPGEQVGSVMGAFYAFRRDWYMSIGEPWSALDGYGLDEEMLSIASWLGGGDCRLMPDIEVAHVFRDVSPCVTSRPDFERLWLNRLRLLHIVPVTPPERYALVEALSAAPAFASSYRYVLDRVQADLARPAVSRLKNLWADRRTAWDVFRTRFVDGYVPVELPPIQTAPPAVRQADPQAAVQAPAPVRAPRQVIHVAPTVCKRCNALNSFRQPRSGRTVGATANSPKRQFVECAHCGAKAVRIFDGTVQQGIDSVKQALMVG